MTHYTIRDTYNASQFGVQDVLRAWPSPILRRYYGDYNNSKNTGQNIVNNIITEHSPFWAAYKSNHI